MKRSTSRAQPAAKLSDHIRELQKRILVSVLALVSAGGVVYAFYEPLINILRSPLGEPLYYTSPAGSFGFVMRICLVGGLAIAMPVLVYNMVMFVRPAFKETLSLKRVYLTSAMSSILAISGAAFGFLCILPGTLHFFGGYQVGGLSALISADSYLTFVINIIVTFMLVFQLPLLISFIDIIKPLPPKKLLSYEKWVILGSLIVSLIVPFSFDLLTSLLVALPIVVLFNLSIVIVALRHAAIKRKQSVSNYKTFKSSLITDEPGLLLDNLSFENLTAIDVIETPLEPVRPVRSSVLRAGMDIRPLKVAPRSVELVKPQRPQIQRPINNRVHLISDFTRLPKPNRALTSQ